MRTHPGRRPVRRKGGGLIADVVQTPGVQHPPHQASTSDSGSSTADSRDESLSPVYAHIGRTWSRSGWILRWKKVHRRVSPVKPSDFSAATASKISAATASKISASLGTSSLLGPHPQLSRHSGAAPVNVESSGVKFLMANHSLFRPLFQDRRGRLK